ncbi:MAG TPA: glycoside hydrolase family 3 N-terminal domain-containing protein [Terriglobia bacterium]|jgi:beta-N-acetylhexosaminidase
MRDAQRLTLEQKIGQLFVLGFQGHQPDQETSALLDYIQPGGFHLFQRNIESFDQIYDLTVGLRSLPACPPLLTIDHEGGRVDRLKQIFAPIPSMPELAATGMAQLRLGARVIAAELEATGFNVDFAPVLDLRYPGSVLAERTLALDPSEVVRFGNAFVEELSKRGILSCVKHFPGLGSATIDSHFALPRIERTRRQIQQADAAPFVSVFGQTQMIMIAHAHFPALGDEKPVPASLSSKVVEGFLRKKLGYSGLTITDDLTMGAVTSIGLTPELFLKAFEAGNDLLLFSQTTPLVEKAFKTILSEVRRSAALRQRVDESVERILGLKAQIEFVPLRYRAHLKARITRQIERLRKSTVEVSARAVSV